MDAIDSLDALDEILKSLAARRLVTYLSDPDRRGAMVTHGFHTEDEIEHLRTHSAPHSAVEPSVHVPSRSAEAGLRSEIDSLKERTAALESEVAELRKQLGMPAKDQ